MEKFLRAKHWQLFLITIISPLIIEIVFTSLFVIDNNPLGMLKIMPFIFGAFMFGLLGWMWSISIGLQPKVPGEVVMKVKKFKWLFYIPVVYFFVFFILMGSIRGASSQSRDFMFLFIVPMHLFSMFCMFYILYFTAKTFKTVELQRAVTFSDFAGEFFLFWFFPIGVWVLQPKINKMIDPEAWLFVQESA